MSFLPLCLYFRLLKRIHVRRMGRNIKFLVEPIRHITVWFLNIFKWFSFNSMYVPKSY